MAMNIKQALQSILVFVGCAAMSDPPYPPPNVMLQFVCLTVSPPGAAGQTDVSGRAGPLIRTEWAVGSREASHHLMLSATRSLELRERLATSEECATVARDTIEWASGSDGSQRSEFCISAVPGFFDANVIVQISVPRLQTDDERRVRNSLWFISSCKIERGPDLFIQGDRFVDGRVLIVPPLDIQPR